MQAEGSVRGPGTSHTITASIATIACNDTYSGKRRLIDQGAGVQILGLYRGARALEAPSATALV